jgi:NAD(P)-dependent dehydrogenase (short-subunit alcohol dehydrogenase family)
VATKRAIVTGASSGIGKATALALADAGVEVVLAARRRVLLEDLADQIRRLGGTATAIACDVSDPADCERLITEARALPGAVEPCLINCAGVAHFGPYHESPVAAVEAQLRANLLGPMVTCHAFLPWALQVGRGHIVNVLSVAAKVPFPGAAIYCTAKAGLLMLGTTLAAEYRTQGLRVTSLLPGSTDTPLWDDKEWVPPKEDMLPVAAVAEAVLDVVLLPADRNVDELVLMPPKGIL